METPTASTQELKETKIIDPRIIDTLIEKCNSENILFGDSLHGLGVRFRHLFVINSECSEDDQVLGLIHCLLYDAPQFKGKTGMGSYRDEAIEYDIRRTAQTIYNTRPDINYHLKKELRNAKRDTKKLSWQDYFRKESGLSLKP